MGLLPQTWIVLAIFVIVVLTNLALTFFNEKYRNAVFKNSTYEKISYCINIIIMAIVLAYSVQCSVYGSKAMPSCNAFSWILTILLVIMFLFNQGSKIYLYVLKDSSFAPSLSSSSLSSSPSSSSS